ncbi:hypothetical protein AB4179_21305 [Vibrio lentus]
MSINELISVMKKSSIDNKDLPIKLESMDALIDALSLISNRSDKSLNATVIFNEGENCNFFEAFSSTQAEQSFTEFLEENGTKLTVLTNDTKKLKNTNLYKKFTTSKYELRAIPQKFINRVRSETPGSVRSYFLGDKESIIVGDFDFNDPNRSTFVNFYDQKRASTLFKSYNKLKDTVQNNGGSK